MYAVPFPGSGNRYRITRASQFREWVGVWYVNYGAYFHSIIFLILGEAVDSRKRADMSSDCRMLNAKIFQSLVCFFARLINAFRGATATFPFISQQIQRQNKKRKFPAFFCTKLVMGMGETQMRDSCSYTSIFGEILIARQKNRFARLLTEQQ